MTNNVCILFIYLFFCFSRSDYIFVSVKECAYVVSGGLEVDVWGVEESGWKEQQ